MQKEYTAWVDKYRPKTVNDCVLPDSVKDYLNTVVKDGLQQNLLFHGGAGTGKTTVARAICDQLDLKYLFINASDDNGIDLVRNQIKKFASSQTLGEQSGRPKVVILDEGDYLNPNTAQPALRSFISEFAKNCRFIMTCNYKNRVIEPLQSRFATLEFSIPKQDKKAIMGEQLKSACAILDNEGVQYDKKVIAEVIVNCFPDFRKTIQNLQMYSIMTGGKIDVGILSLVSDVGVDSLISHMKAKEFEKVRQWVFENDDINTSSMFRKLYDALYKRLEKPSIPQMVVILGDYQMKAAFVADQHINLLACLTEIMMGCNFE
jgi:DNA polymerase III delta prime subunit